METTQDIQIEGKTVRIKLSSAAVDALQKRLSPLHVEMELYFSCMIRKKVRFYEKSPDRDEVSVTDRLRLGFRPIMTKRCSIDETADSPPVTDFPIARPAGFIPHWLKIHYHKGEWQGEFGY